MRLGTFLPYTDYPVYQSVPVEGHIRNVRIGLDYVRRNFYLTFSQIHQNRPDKG